MADGVQITSGSGTTIATDQVTDGTLGTGIQVQYVKLMDGTIDSVNKGIIDSSGRLATLATQTGTWTVQPGNSANTTPWLMQPSDGTHSAAVDASHGLKVLAYIDSSSVNANGQATMANSAPVVISSNQATLAIAADTSQIANGASGTMLTQTGAAPTFSTSGAHTVVALVSSKKIRILSAWITVNGAVNFNFQSHTTTATKTGLTYCAAAGDGLVLPFNPLGWFDTVAGEALDINLSGSVAVDGYINYVAV